jgi:SAM-dependent methyltransferase
MQTIPCDLCGADDASVRFPSTMHKGWSTNDWTPFACTHGGYGRHHPIVQCRHCGLVYTNPRLEGQELLDTYEAVKDPLYVEEQQGRVLTFERHLKPLERITGTPDGRPLLDVGCYTGVFVEIAAKHGWDAWGVEPSRWAVEQARSRGLYVVQGTLSSPDLRQAYFDVLTLWDVIEHLNSPREALGRAQQLLKPGGLIVIHTLDIESPFARLMGARWPWLMEMHVYYFSRHTLCRMLEQCGFRVIRTQTQGRYLRLGYLMNRLGALVPAVGRPAEWLVTWLQIRGIPVPVNLGDLFTVYAQARK